MGQALPSISKLCAYEQRKLLKLAVEKGASPDVLYPEMGAGYNQIPLMCKLALILENYPHSSKLGINFSEEIKRNAGFCNGLSVVWLHSKWLDLVQGVKPNNAIKVLSELDSKKDLSDTDILAISNFADAVAFFQSPDKNNLEMSMANNKGVLDTYGKVLKEKYKTKIFTIDKPEELIDALKKDVHEGELIHILRPMHASGLFKYNGIYYFYDPNENKGEFTSKSPEDIVSFIFRLNKTDVQLTGYVFE